MPAQEDLKPVPARNRKGTQVQKFRLGIRRIPKLAYALILALTAGSLSGCSESAPTTVTIATHDSFVMSDELIKQFEDETGYQLEIVKLGDAGELTNKLVLTKDNPVADAFFGIDNTFAGVATGNGVVDGELTAIDFADVCFNYEKEWFASRGVQPPASWRDLTDSKYRGLTVVENPGTSSTGLAFLFATIGALGEPAWQNWWKSMKKNGLYVVSSWETAYYTAFSGSAGKGDYPIVLSYSSSPADELSADGSSRNTSLNTECFRQTEYAGVLTGAKNKVGAEALIKFMLGDAFQTALPGAMYVYPIKESVKLPETWATLAPAADSFVDVSGLDFDANRSRWIDEWTAIQKSKD